MDLENGAHESLLPRQFDDADRVIVEQLQADGRASYKKLAAASAMPEATVRRRVKRMIDGGVIRVVAVVNSLASGRTVIALIELDVDRDPEEVAIAVGVWEEVTWAAVTLGSASVMLEVICADREGLLDVVKRVHALEGVRDVRSSLYLKVTKALYAGPPPDAVLS